jgi:hypothetical protein
MIADLAKKLDRPLRFKPVSVLEGRIATTRKAQQDVGRCIVAEGDSHLQKRPQGHVNSCIRIFVLQGAVGLGQNSVLWPEAYRLVQRELSLLHLTQDRQRQRQFEDGLHWRVRAWIEIAVQP